MKFFAIAPIGLTSQMSLKGTEYTRSRFKSPNQRCRPRFVDRLAKSRLDISLRKTAAYEMSVFCSRQTIAWTMFAYPALALGDMFRELLLANPRFGGISILVSFGRSQQLWRG